MSKLGIGQRDTAQKGESELVDEFVERRLRKRAGRCYDVMPIHDHVTQARKELTEAAGRSGWSGRTEARESGEKFHGAQTRWWRRISSCKDWKKN